MPFNPSQAGREFFAMLFMVGNAGTTKTVRQDVLLIKGGKKKIVRSTSRERSEHLIERKISKSRNESTRTVFGFNPIKLAKKGCCVFCAFRMHYFTCFAISKRIILHIFVKKCIIFTFSSHHSRVLGV